MLLSLSLSAKRTPLEIRERFAMLPEELPEIGQALRPHVSELFVVSTCNRVEAYVVPTTRMAPPCLVGLLAQQRGVAPDSLAPFAETARDRAAAEHLFRVTAGPESQVLGEAQISGQVRRSLEAAEAAGLVGHRLGGLVRHALNVGGRVRQETALGRGSLSVPRVAVEQAAQAIGGLEGRTALLVGAGETGQLAAKALAGAARLIVANRTVARAEAVAREHAGGSAIALAEVGRAMASADLVVACIGAAGPTITRRMVAAAQRSRGERPLLLVDLAVPRSIEPSATQVPNVQLITVADVREQCSARLAERLREVPRAEAIVAGELARAWRTWEAAEARETIMALRHWADAVRREKLDRSLRGPRALSPEQIEAVDLLTQSLVDRLLHVPTVWLRTHPDQAASVLQEIFGLECAS